MAEPIKNSEIPRGYLMVVDKLAPLRKHLTDGSFHPGLRKAVIQAEILLLKGLDEAEHTEATNGTIQR